MSTPDEKPTGDIKSWLEAVVSDEAEATTTPAIQATREPTCFPHQLRIDGKKRTVHCGRCGKEFTPFDALLYLSRDWVHYRANLTALQGDIKRLTETRERIRRQVKNLKATAKRHGGVE